MIEVERLSCPRALRYMRKWIRILALGCLLVGLLQAQPAAANQAVVQAEGPGGPATPHELLVRVESADEALTAEAIYRAIQAELQVPVAAAGPDESGAVLSVVVDRHGVARVRYDSDDGHSIERSVDLPRDAQRRLETIALLAGNLARDEAAELIALLRENAPAAPAADEPPPPIARSEDRPANAPARPTRKTKLAPPTKSDGERGTSPKPTLKQAPINLSLFYPVALYPDSERLRLSVELGLFYSRVGGIAGFGGNAIALFTESDSSGALFSGVLNYSTGGLDGAEGAGVVNVRRGGVRGAQGAGVVNVAERVTGAQLSGVVNVARGPVKGVQLSGVVNVANEETVGAQLGLVNVGGRVKGAQLGLVNVAERVDGMPIGLVNAVGNGKNQMVAWYASDHTPFNVALKYLHGYVYTMLAFGYDREGGQDLFAPGAGGGLRFPFAPVFVELDVLWQHESTYANGDEGHHIVRQRSALGVELVYGLSVFAGGGPLLEVADGSGTTAFDAHFFTGVQVF